ncbi:MAG: pyrrolo-quinoline quinone, partial [Myxococcota bacterium]|nr:pyrrolo-quinoline quinone [Myxococcota bacterium]
MDAGVDATLSDAAVESGGPPGSGTTVVWTNRYNNAGTGAILTEKILTPATVGGPKFGLLFSLPVDGTVQAQPLYIPGLTINGAQHNVVFLATENDTIYAYDADVSAPALWSRSMGTAFRTSANPDGTGPVFGCSDLFPVVGINSTPVIDTNTGTMYVVAKTSVGGTAHQFLHALDIKTGADRSGSPTEIAASVPGTGEGNVGGMLAFDPKVTLQRAGLLLEKNVIYIAWASHCDLHPYHGWVMAYDATTLAQKGVYNDTPNGAAGGIWQSGMGLTSDGTGVFFVSGNGDFDRNGGNGAGANKGLSVGRLTLGAGGLTLADSFTPYNAVALNTNDNDLTTSAVIAPGTNYLYMSGKDSHLRVLNRSKLGGFSTTGRDSQIPQDIYMGGGHVHGGPVVWQGSKSTLFAWNEG